MNKVLLMSLAGGVLLAGCGGGAGSSSTSGSAVSGAQVSIDAMTIVPVINGMATKGTLYIHNYGNTTATGLHFA